VFLASPRVNFLLETVDNRFQPVVSWGRTQWSSATYISPGVRWAYNFQSGLQIVPGVALPIGIGGSAGEKGILLYLSFEHRSGNFTPIHRGERRPMPQRSV
jgi:hypothetical protein